MLIFLSLANIPNDVTRLTSLDITVRNSAVLWLRKVKDWLRGPEELLLVGWFVLVRLALL